MLRASCCSAPLRAAQQCHVMVYDDKQKPAHDLSHMADARNPAVCVSITHELTQRWCWRACTGRVCSGGLHSPGGPALNAWRRRLPPDRLGISAAEVGGGHHLRRDVAHVRGAAQVRARQAARRRLLAHRSVAHGLHVLLPEARVVGPDVQAMVHGTSKCFFSCNAQR